MQFFKKIIQFLNNYSKFYYKSVIVNNVIYWLDSIIVYCYCVFRKAKTWERDRRSRMNAYFNNLAELLPPQSDGRKRNKVDIIIQAIKYIKELHNKTDDLIQTSASTVHSKDIFNFVKFNFQQIKWSSNNNLIMNWKKLFSEEELARLKKLVHQLFMRTHLLSNLLKDAGITVPAEPALEKISPLKWSNKINVNTAEKIISNFDSRKFLCQTRNLLLNEFIFKF